ncbi:protein-tyrosine phosphatase-like protein [Vararia minispora EC-137]|uniref:Protein-tyrosine phosphatase-like protein n=1 Tax=Vararia minispora EC-137 TaxID=1314806 RepID=A0ACB8QQ80_9AGAM|nr:protein-tyrosine phosphatase-like protein [Vararia minispora EC-137]
MQRQPSYKQLARASPRERTITSVVSRPIPNSYWATPLLLACEYPWTPSLNTSRSVQKIDLLLLAGIRTFIDLTESGELSPYAPHLSECVTRLGIDPREVEYHNFPVRDRCTPASVDFVHRIMRVLADNERRGRITAVHCRGGIGRTGLVVGCWLVESGAAQDGPQALSIIAREWQTVEKCKRYPCSPETGGQCEFVKNFVPRSMPSVA